MLDNKLSVQIKDDVRKLYMARKEKAAIEELEKKESLVISNFMFSNMKDNSFEIRLDEGNTFYAEPVNVKVTNVRTKKIVWNIEKLKQKIGKTVLKKLLKKKYIITDFEGLVKYLKQCGVDPKKFKKYISVEESVDTEMIDHLYSVGAITKKQVNDCYKVQVGNPQIRITEMNSR